MIAPLSSDRVVALLRRALTPKRVSVLPRDLDTASHDESDMQPVTPLCVCRPTSAAEVQGIVRVALENGVPITARGAGTSLEGSSIPSPGAIVVDFSLMDRVIEVVPEEQRVTTEPGVVYDALNRKLSPCGMFFPPSPGGSGDSATLGGMVSTDASGIYALRYGGTRRWVLALDVVTGTGEAMRVGSLCPKTSAGLDLKDLFVGAEGTLGLVTGVTLRLAPVPFGRLKSAFLFGDLPAACTAAAEMAAYIPEIAALELVDGDTLDILRGLPGNESLPSGHCLFVEVHGRETECEAGAASCDEAATARGGTAHDPGIPDPWALRHRTTGAIREAAQPAGVVRTDCAVPLRRVAEFVATAKKRTMFSGRRLYVYGHVGLGILHLLMPLAGPGAWPAEEALAEKEMLALHAVDLGGSLSGEHGVGLGNRRLLAVEHPVGIAYMKAVKAVFDPRGIMNPDKILS